MTEAPRHVTGLAEQRAKARAERDFASADALRAEIEGAGWLVKDTADGFTLSEKPPYEVWPTVKSIPVSAPEDFLHAQRLWDAALAANRLDESTTTVGVGLVVDGWPDDLRACVESVLAHTSAHILAIDLGNLDGAGDALHELAGRHPERITAWHVAEAPHWRGGTAGWGASRTKLLQLDGSDVHVLMETSTVLTGDAITPLVAAIGRGAVAAGWKGVEPAEDGREWREAGPGEVRALLGYLMAVRRSVALGAFPEKARYYRNADLELSLAMGGPLVVPDETLPVRQERHRAYHEVSAEYRDKESRRTYDRVLRMLRSS